MARNTGVTLVNFPRLPAAVPDRFEKTLQLMEALVEQASATGSSLVVFPECCNQRGAPDLFDRAEPLDGPTLLRMTRTARERRIAVVCPMITAEHNRRYNTSVLIGDDGTIAGVYHKMFPTPGELDAGITPGTGTPVFDVGFGRVGMCLCFDLEFREVGDGLSENGAELVLWPSMYHGGRMLQRWGLVYGFAIGACFEHRSTLVDGAGRVVASRGRELHDFLRGASPAFLTATIDLGQRVLHHYENVDRLEAVFRAHGPNALDVEWLTDEALLVISSRMEDRSTDAVIREFHLETRRQLHARARAARSLALEGRYRPGGEHARDWTLSVYPEHPPGSEP